MPQAMGWKRFEVPGRYAVTVQCADDLSDDELIIMEGWFETTIALLQKQDRGYTDEQAARWKSEALRLAAAPQAGK